MPPRKGSHQKYSTAVEAFLKAADYLGEEDVVWTYMAKDIARDLDENGTNGTMLSQFSKVISRLEGRKPKPPEPEPELPPVVKDQLDIFMEQNGL